MLETNQAFWREMPSRAPDPNLERSDSIAVDLALFAVVVMWASTFSLFKLAWRDMDPVAFTAVRFASMVVFALAILATARSRVRLERRDLPLIVASGLSGYFLYQNGAAAAFGAYGVITRPLAHRYPSRELMAYTLGVGGVLIVLAGVPAILRQDWGSVSGQSWIILGYAAIFPVYLAYALWNWAIRRRGVTRTVVYGFLTPVLAGSLDIFGLGEGFRPEQILGGLMVVAGLILTRLRRTAAPPPGAGEPPSDRRARQAGETRVG